MTDLDAAPTDEVAALRRAERRWRSAAAVLAGSLGAALIHLVRCWLA